MFHNNIIVQFCGIYAFLVLALCLIATLVPIRGIAITGNNINATRVVLICALIGLLGGIT